LLVSGVDKQVFTFVAILMGVGRFYNASNPPIVVSRCAPHEATIILRGSWAFIIS
jgi:hypothetical protein